MNLLWAYNSDNLKWLKKVNEKEALGVFLDIDGAFDN
jgi:hypothetical protein